MADDIITVEDLEAVSTLADTDVIMVTHSNHETEVLSGANLKAQLRTLMGLDPSPNFSAAALAKWNATNKVWEPIALPSLNNTVLTAVVENNAVSYQWKSGGSGSVSRFATLAAAQTALAIEEGQDGYIPNNGIVIIDELNPYLKGEDVE